VTTAGVDFFRVDRSGATKRLLAVAGLLVLVGMTTIGAHLVRRLPADLAHTVTLAGGLTLASGLILGFGAMAMLLFENVYLLIREEGLLLHENGKEISIPWSDLESTELDREPGFLRFSRAGGEPVRWFAGNVAKDVHAKIEAARRKALHGLLRDA